MLSPAMSVVGVVSASFCQIVQEMDLSTTVEGCDCQGECGYGPNLLIDGKLVNSVRGREAVLQALGLCSDNDDKEEE